MLETKQPVVIDDSSVGKMIAARDFSRVEGNVPELVAYLLKATPNLMQTAFEAALENKEVRAEVCNYIHETSNQVLSEYSEIVKLEQQNLHDTNQKLGDVLLQLAKKNDPSPDEIQMYFTTLQQINWNNTRGAESVQQSEKFFDEVYQSEVKIVKPKESIALKAVVQVAETPEGNKLIAEGLVLIGKALYKSFTKNYK